jgi:hypothetical protein
MNLLRLIVIGRCQHSPNEAVLSSAEVLARPPVEPLDLDEQSFRRLCEDFSRILILELTSAPSDRGYYSRLISKVAPVLPSECGPDFSHHFIKQNCFVQNLERLSGI